MTRFLSAFVYYCIAMPISLLPFWALYIISDIVYILTYYIVGYRKKVVRENLKNSFPEFPEERLKKIEEGFYKHFADFLVESAKSLTISDKEIRKRCNIINPELVNKYYDEGRDVMILCGHYNNWEYYAVGLAQQMKHKTVAVYQPLKNDFYDKKILNSRQRFGLKMLSIREFPRFLNEKGSIPPTLSVVINDQSPRDVQHAHWNTFLNQQTGWMPGGEKLATKHQQAVVFGTIYKKKRGFYEVEFSLITEHPENEVEGFITDKHSQYLETVIRKEPQYWLWSHRRWKYQPLEVV
ncbi:MAG: hypothetical protein H3C31_06360 [Brumimicrobium sp.]|nr:hypothetical protein [Brumimicrobium sp.]